LGLVKNPATNKAPPKTPNPAPPPQFLPRDMQLYPITKVIVRRFGFRKRGRPFGLFRGRLPNRN